MSSKPLFYALICAAMASSMLYAEDTAPAAAPECKPSAEMHRPGFHQHRPDGFRRKFFSRLLTDAEFIKEIGLSDEKAAAIKKGIADFDAKEAELHKSRFELIKKQTEKFAALMSDRSLDGTAVKDSFKEIEALQLKIDELIVDRMVFIRDNLDESQVKKAVETIKARREKMQERFKALRDAKKDAPPPPPAEEASEE